MEHNTITPCEKNLMRDIDMIVNAGIRRASTLLVTPRLYDMFMDDLGMWLNEVGCRQKNILAIARRIWFGPTDQVKLNELVDPMANRVLVYIFREGKRKTYPALNALLKVAHDDGSQAAIRYLMQMAENYARDQQRRFNVRCAHCAQKVSHDKNPKRRSNDPGNLVDPINSSPEEKLVGREISNAVMTQLGVKFPGDVVFLAQNAKLTREKIADYFAEGRVPDLVEFITHELSLTAGRDCYPFLGLLRQKAQDYILPARLKGNREALVNYLFRQTNGKKRADFIQRGKARGY